MKLWQLYSMSIINNALQYHDKDVHVVLTNSTIVLYFQRQLQYSGQLLHNTYLSNHHHLQLWSHMKRQHLERLRSFHIQPQVQKPNHPLEEYKLKDHLNREVPIPACINNRPRSFLHHDKSSAILRESQSKVVQVLFYKHPTMLLFLPQ